ncbi:UPF0585 protein CG18661 isoform X1 [Euwallacea fornicatus]|uniref:UPF0585 protein CG18661 isoform X1 n=1 Tax=Euwallacea fornicatus TaxID=995702 RepID=UPI00338E89B0
MGDLFRKAHRTISYPAAEKNKTFILDVLLKYIQKSVSTKLLEIASGTGQHAAYFALKLPNVTIQPSELDLELMESIRGYAEQCGNLKEPVRIDVDQGPWPIEKDFDYLLNVNMFHVAPYSSAVAFFKYGSQVLKNGALIFTYGPYANEGVLQPQSNINFDQGLRKQNPKWGIRDIRDLKKDALIHGISLRHIHELPANNKCLVWQKD